MEVLWAVKNKNRPTEEPTAYFARIEDAERWMAISLGEDGHVVPDHEAGDAVATARVTGHRRGIEAAESRGYTASAREVEAAE